MKYSYIELLIYSGMFTLIWGIINYISGTTEIQTNSLIYAGIINILLGLFIITIIKLFKRDNALHALSEVKEE